MKELITIEKARELLFNDLKRFISVENIKLSEAYARILGEDIYSKEELPTYRKSTVDGYGACFGSLDNKYKNIGQVNIGESTEYFLEQGECIYIPTGGLVPDDCDFVVKIEETKECDGFIFLDKTLKQNENIVEIGKDLEKNILLFRKGATIDARIMGVLGACGIVNVPVIKRLRVFILSSGNELVNVEEVPKKGQSREINSIFIKNTLIEFGFLIVGEALISDDFDNYKKTLESYDADIYITSGGSSMGKYDYTGEVFEELTGNVYCHGISIKPGKPTILASNNNKLYIGLPGHPLASLFVLRELLIRTFGDLVGNNGCKKIMAKVDKDILRSENRALIVLGNLYFEHEQYYVKPIIFASSNLMKIGEVDGYFYIPNEISGYNKGEFVEISLF